VSIENITWGPAETLRWLRILYLRFSIGHVMRLTICVWYICLAPRHHIITQVTALSSLKDKVVVHLIRSFKGGRRNENKEKEVIAWSLKIRNKLFSVKLEKAFSIGCKECAKTRYRYWTIRSCHPVAEEIIWGNWRKTMVRSTDLWLWIRCLYLHYTRAVGEKI
jgi:hypothetical protein